MTPMRTDPVDQLDSATSEPRLVRVPPMSFLSSEGRGDPSGPDFTVAVRALFSVAYAMKLAVKRAYAQDIAVPRLESQWWADDMSTFTAARRSQWRWTAMVRQPDLVTADLARSVIAAVQSKRPDLQVGDLRMVRLDEGPAAQVMHIGPYTTEGPTIERLHAFIHDHGLEFDGIRHKHHEIYLNDPRRTRPDRLRTIIRQPYWPRRATVGRHPLATDAASLG